MLTACETDEIPTDASVAVCPQGYTFKYVYKEDIVYEFYTSDVLQSKDMLNIVQSAVDAVGDLEAYLDSVFPE